MCLPAVLATSQIELGDTWGCVTASHLLLWLLFRGLLHWVRSRAVTAAAGMLSAWQA